MEALSKTINIAKNKLRKILILATKALKIDELTVNHRNINQNLNELLEELNLQGSTAILTYQAFFPAEVPLELDTTANTYYPKLDENNNISFYQAKAEELVPGKLNIPEPEIDAPLVADNYDNLVILVPGLGFSTKGERMGRGLGCYDNYIAQSGLDLIKIGISLEQFVLEDIPVEEHDQSVDYLITGTGIRKFV